MKNGIKYLVAGLVATGVMVSASYANVSVSVGTSFNAFLTDNTGAANYLSGDLIEIGSFASAPTVGSPSLAGFTVFGSGLTGTGAGAGTVSLSLAQNADGVYTHNQIYLVVFNNATGINPTQEGIFDVNDVTNTKWKFPSTSDTINTTSIDVQDLFVAGGGTTLAPGAQIVFGGKGTDGSGPFSLAETALVPEPSTWMLVGTGLLGLLGLRRRRS